MDVWMGGWMDGWMDGWRERVYSIQYTDTGNDTPSQYTDTGNDTPSQYTDTGNDTTPLHSIQTQGMTPHPITVYRHRT